MTSAIWLPLTAGQVRVLMEHHRHEAAHASTLFEREGHLRDADDLQRRLSDFEERTEAAV